MARRSAAARLSLRHRPSAQGRKRDGVFGTLNIYASEPNAFTAEEIRLLEELAGDLAFGIMVLRARAERKHIDRRLQANLHFFECMDQVNLAIQETHDLEQMMSQVLERDAVDLRMRPRLAAASLRSRGRDVARADGAHPPRISPAPAPRGDRVSDEPGGPQRR